MSSPRRPQRHLTYANLTSTFALVLVVAVGGAATAGTVAKTVAKNTVVSKSIKDGAVTTKDVQDGSLTGTDIADNSLTGSDVDESKLTLAPSSVGSTNITDGSVAKTDLAAGSVSAGKLGTLNKFETTVPVAGNTIGTAIATCPAGSVAISGGGRSLSTGLYVYALSRENASEAWVFQAANTVATPGSITAFVYCLAS